MKTPELTVSKQPYLPIRQWDAQDRPREKFMAGNIPAMLNEELLAILIGSGTGQCSALDIARGILHHFNGNLQEISYRSPKELIRRFNGIGEAKAVSILAGLELGKRSCNAEPASETFIRSSADAFRFICKEFSASPYERFFVLLLSQSCRLIRKVLISEGGTAATLVDAKKIFKFAIDEHASGIILSHNHPSGNTKPSPEDIGITERICKGARLLDLYVFDHIIVSGHRYFSFSDENLVLEPLSKRLSSLPIK
ncbi:MAG: DNA repair protein RadC [Bacteroidales bacterium]|nr:DNA repair protein RadC [Bacteroidales bacterium]MDE7072255.1 DNA repair protein RadC [Bacteroidales bacterium]